MEVFAHQMLNNTGHAASSTLHARPFAHGLQKYFTPIISIIVGVNDPSFVLVLLARPSHLNVGCLGLGRGSPVAVTTSSHLFNQSDVFGKNSC